MEPETSIPKIGSERAPVDYGQGVERAPTLPLPESGIETGAERREQASEAAATIADSGLPTTLPPLSVTDNPTAVDDSSISDTPLVASDDDLIEREWVDKAKKIIIETKEDPYKREEAVNQLQKDYQKKRYGRELGEA